MPQEPFAYVFWLVVCLAVGFVIALITELIKRSSLKSVVKKTSAEDYMKENSFQLTTKQDRFINRVVTSRPIPKDDDSHSGGGGSTTHVSSSGETHGGHSGKFSKQRLQKCDTFLQSFSIYRKLLFSKLKTCFERMCLKYSFLCYF